MDLFGYEIKRKAAETKAQSFVPPSNDGDVIEVGKDVKSFKIGDRVISNGKHAEVVSVPANLCSKIPDNI